MPEITVTDKLPATHHQSTLVLCKQWATARAPTSDLIDWALHGRQTDLLSGGEEAAKYCKLFFTQP